MHISVLLYEVLALFETTRLKSFVDGTLGAGGHSAAILEAHPELETFIGIDQDPDALNIAKNTLENWQSKTQFFQGNFTYIHRYLTQSNIDKVDGILLDLGVSSMQLDRPEKGFSFMRNGPLDMRMDPQNPQTAELIVNNWSEEELGRIFRDYGEEKKWRLAAKAIVSARKQKPITTTFDLVDVLKPMFPWQKKGVNPLTLIFQALRIAVNNELNILSATIESAINLLSPKGRLAIISFHSLEDRIVKEAFRFAASDKYDTSGIGGIFRDKEPSVILVTKKPLVASEEEISSNPRSRSAKLRCIEKR